jgi:exo-1,4-beta-D-glucosaminidase
MLNNAWPSLHWNFFDYYLKAAGSYFGAKVGSRPEHVAFEYGSQDGDIWLINHTLDKQGARSIDIDLLSKDGAKMASKSVAATTQPNYSQRVASVPEAAKLKDVAFLRLVLRDARGAALSRNVYWLAPTVDKMDWDNSTWYYTPVTTFASYKSLQTLKPAKLSATGVAPAHATADGRIAVDIALENQAAVPAYFVRLELQDASGADMTPAFWTDNYVTLWPGEKTVVGVSWPAAGATHGAGTVKISGVNVGVVKSVALKW